MPTYLTPAEYPSIRAAIDISLDPTNLPDSVIGLPLYREEAERWVLTMNPAAATYTPGSDAYLKTQVAAIYACAAMVAPAVPVLTGETYGQEFRYTRKETDMATLSASLWEKARSALKSASAPPEISSTPPRRFIFTTAKVPRYIP